MANIVILLAAQLGETLNSFYEASRNFFGIILLLGTAFFLFYFVREIAELRRNIKSGFCAAAVKNVGNIVILYFGMLATTIGAVVQLKWNYETMTVVITVVTLIFLFIMSRVLAKLGEKLDELEFKARGDAREVETLKQELQDLSEEEGII